MESKVDFKGGWNFHIDELGFNRLKKKVRKKIQAVRIKFEQN